jgi:hypothetical protein
VGNVLASDLDRVIGRVVENLNLESVARPVKGYDGIDGAPDDIALVIDGQLYGDHGMHGKRWAN